MAGRAAGTMPLLECSDRMTAPPRLTASPLIVAVAGALCLSAAMGIGRFAFTPLLPMMLRDGVIDLAGGSRLATANYLGYLLGALSCMALPALRRLAGPSFPGSAALVRIGLALTTLFTLGMVPHAPLLWVLLRFLAGYVTGIVFVCASGWCLAQLARMGRASLGGIIYTGPGIGITVSGLAGSAMAAHGQPSSTTWAVFGLIAAALTALVWPVFRGHESFAAAPGQGMSAQEPRRPRAEQPVFVLAYGLAGFGYIITATFLPVIARQAIPDSTWADYFWPAFGVGVIAGALLTRFVPLGIDRRLLLAACYVVQALAVALTVVLPTDPGFVAGSLLLGLPFTAITLFAMQDARRLRPAQATSLMGLLTGVYGVGQILGPPLVAVLLSHTASAGEGFTVALTIAASSLVLGASLYLALVRCYPVRAEAR